MQDLITEIADKQWRDATAKGAVPINYRQSLEKQLEDELRSLRSHAAQLTDNNSKTVFDWWARHGLTMPLLYSYAQIGMITPIVTLEVEREFGCQGKSDPIDNICCSCLACSL